MIYRFYTHIKHTNELIHIAKIDLNTCAYTQVFNTIILINAIQ